MEYLLKNTEIAIADEIAAASGLLMGQGSDMQPVILLKGFNKDKYDINNAIDFGRKFSKFCRMSKI